MVSRIGTAIVVLLSLAAASAAWAQPRLVAPDEVVIHVHPSIENADFVEGLVCELGRVLVAPVRATTIDLPLTADDLATPTQLDVSKVSRLFRHATGGEPGGAFKYLILRHDLTARGLNYVFAQTLPDADHLSVMSISRLMPTDPGLTRKRVSDVTGERLYKLMLKSIAVLAGLRTNGCVMAFPRSLADLDAKAAEFCAADRAAMIDAGILKARPFGACNTVAMADR